MTWLQVVLTALLTYRVALLVTRDSITEPARGWLRGHYTGSLVEFVHCVWCTSMWIGAGATVLTIYEWWWWQWVCFALSMSAVAGFLGERS